MLHGFVRTYLNLNYWSALWRNEARLVALCSVGWRKHFAHRERRGQAGRADGAAPRIASSEALKCGVLHFILGRRTTRSEGD